MSYRKGKGKVNCQELDVTVLPRENTPLSQNAFKNHPKVNCQELVFVFLWTFPCFLVTFSQRKKGKRRRNPPNIRSRKND